MAILKKHGYTGFSDDERVVRVKGQQRFGEYVAGHPQRGAYTLYVRRGGAANLQRVAEDLGRSLEGAVLAIRYLDLVGLDRMLSKLVRSLRTHPVW